MQGVSVYIPILGTPGSLRYCLDGLLSQSLLPDEIIILHDCTSKAVQSIVARYRQRLRLIKLSKALGRANVKNLALQSARYDLVASLNPNCVPQKNWLQSLVRQMRNQANVIGVGGPLVEVHTDSLSNQYRCVHFQHNQGEKLIRNPNNLQGGNTIYRRQSVLAMGGYNNRLQSTNEDVELTKRIRARGGNLIYEPKAGAYRMRRDGFTSLMALQWESLSSERNPEHTIQSVPLLLKDTAVMMKTIWRSQVLPDFKCKRFMLGLLGLVSMAAVPMMQWKSSQPTNKSLALTPGRDN